MSDLSHHACTAECTDEGPTSTPVYGCPTKGKPSRGLSPSKKEEKPKAQDVAELKDYQLGDCLGKGAHGAVYRALNWG